MNTFGKEKAEDGESLFSVLINGVEFQGFAPEEGEAIRRCRDEHGLSEVASQSARKVEAAEAPAGHEEPGDLKDEGEDGNADPNAGGKPPISADKIEAIRATIKTNPTATNKAIVEALASVGISVRSTDVTWVKTNSHA